MDDSESKALIERLRENWRQQGIDIRPGVFPPDIESFESRYQVRLPPDLRAYFATIDGMDKWATDHNMFSFLSLTLIKSIPEELAHFGGIPDYREIMRTLPDPHRWFVIVDYLITSAVGAIRLSALQENTPVVWIDGGKHYRDVAPSFSGFLETYLANPAGLIQVAANPNKPPQCPFSD